MFNVTLISNTHYIIIHFHFLEEAKKGKFISVHFILIYFHCSDTRDTGVVFMSASPFGKIQWSAIWAVFGTQGQLHFRFCILLLFN